MRPVIVTGSQYWARYLAEAFVSRGHDAKHISHRPQHLMKCFGQLQSNILAVGFGGKLDARTAVIWSVLFIWWLLHRRSNSVCLYWIGGDVLNAKTRGVSGILRYAWATMGVTHLCGAPWFLEELRQVKVVAESVVFPYDTGPATLTDSISGGERPQVLAYLRPSSWENMRGERVLKLAALTPNLDWNIIGMQRDEVPGASPVSENVQFAGWVSNPLMHLAECDVFIRLVDHDAYSGMVRDAQAMGKIVLYSLPVPRSIFVGYMSDEAILSILRQIEEGELQKLEHLQSAEIENPSIIPPFSEQLTHLWSIVSEGYPT